MKKLIAFLALCTVAHAVGTVQQNLQNVGGNVVAFTFYWTGDAANGSVPATVAQGTVQLQGYRVISTETTPGSPAPTNGYSITLIDTAGVDILAGAGASLSSSSAQAQVASPTAPPLYGSFSFTLTGNSVNSARGSMIVYLAPLSQVLGLSPTAPNFPAQGPNLFYSSPNGSSGSPGFRSFAVPGDLGAQIIPLVNGGTGVTAGQGVGDTKVELAGTNTGTLGALLCNDANGGATTSGCGSTLPAGVQTQFLHIQPNTGNNTTAQFVNPLFISANDYNFPTLSPAGTIGVGSNTVTITPCPLGVNGTDTNHFLFISGTGTPEAVAITGGTCTSGLSSGTVIFTAVNTHSAGFTINSVMGGIPEADQANQGQTITATSNINANGSVTLHTGTTLQCATGVTITLTAALGATGMIKAPNANITIKNCIINGNQPTGSVTSLIDPSGSTYFSLLNSTVKNGSVNAIQNTSGAMTHWTFMNDQVFGNLSGGISIINSGNNFGYLTGSYVDSTGCTVLNCGAISVNNASHVSIVGNRVVVGGNQDGGLFLGGIVGSTTTSDGVVAGNTVKGNGNNTFECGEMNGLNMVHVGNTCDFTGQTTNPSSAGWEFNTLGQSVIADDVFFGASGGNVSGYLMESTNNVTVTGAYMQNLGTNGRCISLLNTNATFGMSNNHITGVNCQMTGAGGSGVGLKLDTLTTGTVANNTFEGNRVIGVTTAGYHCLDFANSGAATESNIVVKDNVLTTCDTAIFDNLGGGVAASIENNTILGSNTLIALNAGNTPRIIDTTGGTATAVAGAATLNAMVGTVTSESLTTAAGSVYNLTLTDNLITANSTVLANSFLGTSAAGTPQVLEAVPSTNQILFFVKNVGASPFNGTIKVQYHAMNN